MAVRSVIEVEVVDDAFKAFSALFDRYSQQVKDTAATREKSESKADGWLRRQTSSQKELNREREKANSLGDKANQLYEEMERRTGKIARNLKDGVASLLRWAASASTFGVLSGGLGLFGLDRLAEGVGAGRKSSMGIGASYGGQKSFNTQFGPVLGDTSGFLHRIGEAQSNPGMQTGLVAAGGFSRQQIEGSTADQLAADLILRLKPLVDKESAATIGTMSSRYKLDEYGITTEDLKRLKAMSSQEVQEHYGKYKGGTANLDQEAKAQKNWQDFAVQLDQAGKEIEQVFVRGLTPLIDPLKHLSETFSHATEAFLKSKTLGVWIDKMGKGLEDFANHIDDPKFQEGVEKFINGIAQLAEQLANLGMWLGKKFGTSLNDHAEEERKTASNQLIARMAAAKASGRIDEAQQLANELASKYPERVVKMDSNALDYFGVPRKSGGPNATNPGNIRGADGKFRQFGSDAEGIKAMGSQLQRYQDLDKWGHLDTIDKIINTYAPKGDHNDTEAYARNVASWTGFKRDQHLDLHDPQQLAKLVSAMTRQEGSGQKYSPEVVVTILNAPGNNANVAAASAR